MCYKILRIFRHSARKMLLARSALECGTLVPLSTPSLLAPTEGRPEAGSKLPAGKAGASSRTPKVTVSNIDNLLSMRRGSDAQLLVVSVLRAVEESTRWGPTASH
jgi:hypothetical protein